MLKEYKTLLVPWGGAYRRIIQRSSAFIMFKETSQYFVSS